MGSAAPALIGALAVASVPSHASAGPTECTGVTPEGARFAACFDLGNRLVIDATTQGAGVGIFLRHSIHFDDEPDLVWKLEHEIGVASFDLGAGEHAALAYGGRYLRHSRDGHIILPFGVGRKLFLPFDIGAEAELGRVRADPAQRSLAVGVVKMGALTDWSRSRNFRRRLAFGVSSRWDIEIDRDRRELDRHVVAPFSVGVLDARAESSGGTTAVAVRLESGWVWASDRGWRGDVAARAGFEWILIAVNDRPLALTANVSYASLRGAVEAELGLRFSLYSRTDPRVDLRAAVARGQRAAILAR